MKFAIVSTHDVHGGGIRMDCSREDCTSFLSWLQHLDGIHFSYKNLREEGFDVLKNFDLVMMSGHPSFITDIIKIGDFLKGTKTVSMFYPEGSAQLYDNSIRGFHPEYYEAWSACDIVSIAEEDKVSYYEAFVTPKTLVRFIHVPTSPGMGEGLYFLPREMKSNGVVVYGDNNPNHPMIALACARALGLSATTIEFSGADVTRTFPDMEINGIGKVPHTVFLQRLARSVLHFYPTEWIGTAREQISCAAAGTPCIGNHDSHTQRRLFPDLACDIYDVNGMVQKAELLLESESFYAYVAEKALKGLKFYSPEESKKRMMRAYFDAINLRCLAAS